MKIQGILDSTGGLFDGSLSDVVIKIGVTIAILVFGVLLSKLLTNSLRKAMIRSKVDKTLISFMCNVVYYSLLVIVAVMALTFLGVPTTSLVAVLGTASLAIGLALQDSIANLASGLSIIALRPITVALLAIMWKSLMSKASSPRFASSIRC